MLRGQRADQTGQYEQTGFGAGFFHFNGLKSALEVDPRTIKATRRFLLIRELSSKGDRMVGYVRSYDFRTE
jgi:hypothetical protein